MANQRADEANTHQEEAKRLVQKRASNNQALTVTPSRLGEKLSSKDHPDKSRLSLASSALPNHILSNEKIDVKVARKLLESFSYCLRSDKAFDLVLQALDSSLNETIRPQIVRWRFFNHGLGVGSLVSPHIPQDLGNRRLLVRFQTHALIA